MGDKPGYARRFWWKIEIENWHEEKQRAGKGIILVCGAIGSTPRRLLVRAAGSSLFAGRKTRRLNLTTEY